MTNAIDYLNQHCTDWDLHYRDWPRWTRAHYVCRACHFFVSARGVGETALEAAQRAVRVMELRDSKLPRGNYEDD